MDSELKIRYLIVDLLAGRRTLTDMRMEAEASFEEGLIVYEIHETTWNTRWTSGQNIVHYEWNQFD